MIKKIFKNKSIVTIVSIAACLVILFFAYRYRVRTAINAIDIPCAARDLAGREKIDSDAIGTVTVARSMLSENVITNEKDLVEKYVNYNTMIPKGGLFYKSAVVKWENMPDSTWASIPNDSTIVSLSVNNTTTFGNSIYPNDKIDLYYQNYDGNKFFIGPLIKGITVLAVKDSYGNHIFKKSAKQRTAAALIFAVPESYTDSNGKTTNLHMLLRNAMYIPGGKITPVPRNSKYEQETVVESDFIENYINSHAENPVEDFVSGNNSNINIIN